MFKTMQEKYVLKQIRVNMAFQSFQCRIMGCVVNMNGCGRKWLWPNLKYCPGIFLKGLRKIMKKAG
jgi:hypothetical protein